MEKFQANAIVGGVLVILIIFLFLRDVRSTLIVSTSIPVSVIGHHEPAAQNFDTVNSDDRLGAMRAVQALYDQGHRDIGMVLTADQPHRGGHADFAVGEVVAVGIDTRQVRKLAQ